MTTSTQLPSTPAWLRWTRIAQILLGVAVAVAFVWLLLGTMTKPTVPLLPVYITGLLAIPMLGYPFSPSGEAEDPAGTTPGRYWLDYTAVVILVGSLFGLFCRAMLLIVNEPVDETVQAVFIGCIVGLVLSAIGVWGLHRTEPQPKAFQA